MESKEKKNQKTGIIISLVVILLSLIFISFFLLKRKNVSIKDIISSSPLSQYINKQVDQVDIEKDFNLNEGGVPLVACVLNFSDDINVCYNKNIEAFVESDILNSYESHSSLFEGFGLLEITKDDLYRYSVDIQAVFDKWFNDIEVNEKEFFVEIDGVKHTDLYNYAQWKVLQYKRGLISGEQLHSDLAELLDPSYSIMSPIRQEDLELFCTISYEGCERLNIYSTSRSHEIAEHVTLNNDSDNSDIFNAWSKIVMSNIGLKALNESKKEDKEAIMKCKEFLEHYMEENGIATLEEIEFLGGYVPFKLAGYWQVLYNEFKRDKGSYYKFVDIFCNSDLCLQTKLNILYDEQRD
ncbi:hypothetical protein GX888_02755 [Candidatus Dojkabacteria bacterium]|uniref:Uncharacterized protein n=1 Tax=Candidatus Dojkabacteria bacterium TaxID=2099670 RepID=A0A847VDK8_9BACT|nr:hypothetical protein [Candidatus Dojkabacteria bacterium]